MSQRERQASGTLSEPALRPASGPSLPARSPALAEPSNVYLPSWEEIYRQATAAQQRELLALAERQGLLYAHQLPASTNGAPMDPSRRLLSQLLAGQTEGLEPVQTASLAWIDPELDEAQRAAVARGLSTPDVCLIQGLPGTGKSRVVAELISQAAAQGQRILFLAASAAAVDCVLEQIGQRSMILALRCLGREEHPDTLPPPVRALTLAARVHQFTEETLPEASRLACEAAARCQRRRDDEPIYGALGELARQFEELDRRQGQLQQQSAAIPGEVEREAAEATTALGPADTLLARDLTACLAARTSALADIQHRRDEQQRQASQAKQQLDQLHKEMAELRPLVEAKQQGRWWTWTWWQAGCQGNVVARMNDLQAAKQNQENLLAEIGAQLRHLDEAQVEAEKKFLAARAAVCEAEMGRRQEQIQAQLADVGRRCAALQEEWHQLTGQLDGGSPQPADQTMAAVQAAYDSWRQLLEREEQQTALARSWAEALEANRHSYPPCLLARTNVVAGPLTALTADETLGALAGPGCGFDLLVFEEAHRASEAELLQAACRARRWVFVGEPEWAFDDGRPTDRPFPPGPKRESSRGSRPGLHPRPPAAPPPRPFARLWQNLHAEPRSLPYAWVQEGDRWCCRLRFVTDEQRRQLESERVADCPDIELRILTQPGMPPALAEVVFPSSMSLVQAKEYIFKELQELPIQALGQSLFWLEDPDRMLLRLSDVPLPATVPVVLDQGVRELVSLGSAGCNGEGPRPPAGITCCLEFDRRTGWDRPRAEDWVRQHLPIRDLGRTVRLPVAHRMHPDLAAFLDDLLFAGSLLPRARDTAGPNGLACARDAVVQFVAVPALSETQARKAGDLGGSKPDNGRRAAGASRARPGRGGAGLEVDLADPRQRERLPLELRDQLPSQGLVNWAEAQAMIHLLEDLAHRDGNRRDGWPGSIGVTALYAAQLELIQCLVRQSPLLSAGRLSLWVGDCQSFRQRECDLLLIGLTRSHSHRAVTFGHDVRHLALSLTRARAQVVLFGDVGTLARRCQWEGPVDHLDEVAADRERTLLGRLFQYLHGQGAHPQVFHLREGKCT